MKVTEHEIKTFLGFHAANDMLLVYHVLHTIMNFCVNGKSIKLSSNLDFCIAYRIVNREPLNFLKIFFVNVMEAATKRLRLFCI